MARMEAGGTLWGVGLALLCVLLTHDILTNRKHSWVPSALTTLAAAAVSANFGWLLFVHQSEGDAEGGKDHTFLGMVLLLSLLALGSSFALMVRQVQEAVVDKADLKKLEQAQKDAATEQKREANWEVRKSRSESLTENDDEETPAKKKGILDRA